MGGVPGKLGGGLSDRIGRPRPGADAGHEETVDAGRGSTPPGLRRRVVTGHVTVRLANEQVAFPGEFDEGRTGLTVPKWTSELPSASTRRAKAGSPPCSTARERRVSPQPSGDR